MAVFVRVRDGVEATKAKYQFCKEHGANYQQRCRMRGWRWSKIFRYFHLENDKKVWDKVYTEGQNHLKSINRGEI